MIAEQPRRLIVVGLLLAVMGVVLPALMVIGVIRATFLLSFLAHGASISGLFLGFLGAMTISKRRRDKASRDGFLSHTESDQWE